MNANTAETALKRPHLLYLVAEDWYFVSHRLGLAKAAIAAGYRVTVATRVSTHADTIRAAGIELVTLPFRRGSLNPLREAWFLFGLIRLYRRLRPDVVHHVAIKPVLFGSIAARLSGRPLTVNAIAGMGFLYSAQTQRARLLRGLVKPLLRYALRAKDSAVIVQNRDDFAVVESQLGVGGDRIRLIRGAGVRTQDFDPTHDDREPCLVVLPARMLRDKGVVEFVEAARLLRRQGVCARFALVGSPDLENPNSLSEQELRGWQEEGVVEYWGWRADMPAVLRQAHIVCLPTFYREGVPKSLLEAAAAARPIITTDSPGCRDLVAPGRSGLLVPPRDSRALAAALATLIGDAALCRAMGAEGRRIVEAGYSADYVHRETLTLYAELSESR